MLRKVLKVIEAIKVWLVYKKLQKFIQNNIGFGTICTILRILNGEDNTVKNHRRKLNT